MLPKMVLIMGGALTGEEGSCMLCVVAADALEDQAKEIDRLNTRLKWEQDRSERVGTHADNCHMWGHKHYLCLLQKYEEAFEKK